MKIIYELQVADLLAAHHYLFYIAGHPIIEWQEYLTTKKALIASGAQSHLIPLLTKGEKKVTDYPAYIRSLAYYLLYKHMATTGEWQEDSLPYSWSKEPQFKKV